MNRREEPLPIRARKKNSKLVKNSIETKESAPRPRNTRGQNPASGSNKELTRTKSRVAATKKSMQIKQKKKHAAHSKRTRPGDVEGTPSAPAYAHREAGRWIQSVEKQTLSRSKRLTKKLSKQRSK